MSLFEEATAECISNMLIRFSNSDYIQGSIQASLFINYIESLFFAITQIQDDMISKDPTVTQNKEAKQLSKRIVFFFSLLSSTKEPLNKESLTKEMISLVTNLAYSLKLVIRGALTEALSLVYFIILYPILILKGILWTSRYSYAFYIFNGIWSHFSSFRTRCSGL